MQVAVHKFPRIKAKDTTRLTGVTSLLSIPMWQFARFTDKLENLLCYVTAGTTQLNYYTHTLNYATKNSKTLPVRQLINANGIKARMD